MVKPKVKASCVLLLVVLVLLQPTLGAAYTSTLLYKIAETHTNAANELSSIHEAGELYPSDVSSEVAIGLIQEYPSAALACWGRKLINDLNRHIVQCYNLVSGVILLTADEGTQYEILNFQMVRYKTNNYLVIATENERLTRWTYAPDGVGNFAADPAAPVPTDHKLFNRNIAPATDAPIYYDYQAIAQHVVGTTVYAWALPVSKIDSVTQLNTRNYLVKHTVRSYLAKPTPTTAAITALESLTKGLYFIYFHADAATNNILMIYGDYDKVLLYDVVGESTVLSLTSPIPSCRGPITMYDPATKNDLFASGNIGTVYRMTLTGVTSTDTVDITSSGSLLNTVSRIAGMRPVSKLRAFIVTFFDSSAMELVQTYDMFSEKITGAIPVNSMLGSTVITTFTANTLKVGMIFRSAVEHSGGIQTYSVVLDKCVATKRVGGICSECPLGYTLDVINAQDNQCFRNIESNLPKGPDLINGGDYYCGPGCKVCSTDYRVCEDCTDPLFKLVKFSDTNVRCLASVPTGYGQDLTVTGTVKLYTACTDGCLQCSADNRLICTDCKDKYFRTQATSAIPITCTATLTDGYGLDTGDTTGNPIYRPCTTANLCAKCPDSINMCSECTSNDYNRVQTTATEIKCIAKLGFNQKFGLSLAQPNNYFVKCTDDNCDDCQADFAECSACQTGYTLIKETTSAKKTCLVDSEIPNRLAWNIKIVSGSPTVLEPCTITNCVSCQTSQDVCKECSASKFLHATTATPAVYTCEVSIKTGYGLDSSVAGFTNLYVPCDSRCQSCAANVKACTKCVADTDFRIYKSATDIVCQTTAIDGYGKDTVKSTSTDILHAVCCDADCKECVANLDICTKCKTSANSLKKLTRSATSKVICVGDTTVENGYGIKIKDELIEPCTDLSCLVCDSDVNVCQECATPKLLKFVEAVTTVGSEAPATYTCENSIDPTTGFGLTVPDSDGFVRAYQMCCENCKECFSNLEMCTKCIDPTFYRVQIDATHINCVSPTGYNQPFGRNKYLVPTVDDLYFTKCEQTSCELCVENYESCSKCASGYKLVQLDTQVDIMSCVLTADAPCDIKGCVDCTGDKSKCKECDCENYFLKRTGTAGAYQATCVTELADGFGYVIPDAEGLVNAVAACDARCAICFNNREECTECTDVTDNRINKISENKGIICQASTVAIPAGYGLNELNDEIKYYTPCKYEHCTKCEANYAVCEICENNYKLLMVDRTAKSDVKCVTTVPKGYGADIAAKTPGGMLKLCKDVNCESCDATDYSICEECTTPYLLKYVEATTTPPAAAIYSCETSIPATPPFGLTVPNEGGFVNVYQACCTGCTNCLSNVEMCTKCDNTLYYRVLTSDTTIECKLIAGFAEKFGRNKYLVPDVNDLFLTKCEQANCDLCIENYQSCSKCAATHSLVQLEDDRDIYTCVLNANVPGVDNRGSGKVPGSDPPLIAPCETKGCVSCYDDNTKCKECECQEYFLKRTGTSAPYTTTCVSEIEDGFGYVTPDSDGLVDALAACDIRCGKCFDNVNDCTECLDVTDNRIDKRSENKGIICQLAATDIPDGYGKNEVGGNSNYYTPCKDTNCNKCKANYAVCEICKDTYKLLMVDRSATSEVKCVSTVPKGYGADIAAKTPGGMLKLCKDVNCESCDPTDYSICKECTTPYLLKFVEATTSPVAAAVYSCETTIAANSAFGLTIPNEGGFVDVYQACCTGCKECLNNVEMCTKCDTGYNRVLTSNTVIECKLTAGFAEKFGRNKYLVPDVNDPFFTKCEQEKCDLCIEDYQSCSKCAANYALVRLETNQDILTCVPADQQNDDTTGMGLVVPSDPSRYEPCTIKGCVNCFDDNQKCKECECKEYFLLRTGTSAPYTTTCVEEIADGFGYVTPDSDGLVDALTACETRCAQCFDNVNDCTECKEPTDNRIDKRSENKGIICQLAATAIPAGYGKNEVGGNVNYYTPCKDTNCIKCEANYAVCETCKDAAFKLLMVTRAATSDVICQLANAIPKGYGADIAAKNAGGMLKLCKDLFCESCDATDHSICEECQTPKKLKFVDAKTTPAVTAAAYSCEDTIGAGFGLTVPDEGNFVSIYQECCTGCTECLSNVEMCTKCDNTQYYRVLTSDTTIECILKTGFAQKFGRNEYLVPGTDDDFLTKCEQEKCDLCLQDYRSCTQCAATHTLVRLETNQDILTCVPLDQADDDTRGIGLVVPSSPARYEPCTIKGCVSCFDDNKKCKECECQEYFLKRTGTSAPYTTTCVEEIADGFGYVTPDSDGLVDALAECETRCAKCFDNVNDCTECKEPTDNRIDKRSENKGIICQISTDAIPAGYGKNEVGGLTNYYTPCKDTNCIQCKANYAVCEICKDATFKLLMVTRAVDSDVICQLANAIPKGYGADIAAKTAGGMLKLCKDLFCETCDATDHSICEECATPKFLKYVEAVTTGTPSPAIYTCETTLLPTDKFGLTVPNEGGFINVYQACCEGCDDCFGNAQVCNKCAATYYRVYRGPLDVTCELKSGFVKSFGRNAYMDTDVNFLTACEQTGCKTCLSNYESCEVCTDPTDVLVQPPFLKDILKCVAKKDMPMPADGYGKVTTPIEHYAQCTMAGCIDCYEDNSKCKECDCDHSLKNTGTLNAPVATCVPALAASSAYGVDWAATEYIDLFNPCPDGCAECLDDTKVCNKCTSTAFVRYYVNNLLVFCHPASAPIVQKWGRNKDLDIDDNDLLYTPCKDPHCASCDANYRVCTACEANFALRKPLRGEVDIVCEQTPYTIPKGNGLNTANGVIQQCYDVDCLDCAASDYSICKECPRTKYLKQTPAGVFSCEASLTAASGYGLVVPDAGGYLSLYKSCSTDCLECFENNKVCTKCTATYFRIYDSPTNVYCMSPAGGSIPPDNRGKDSTGDNGDLFFQPCQQASPCSKCTSDYKDCDKCSGSNTLAKHRSETVYTCLANSIIAVTADLGKVLPAGTEEKYEACQIAGCSNCNDDYRSCKECRTGTFLHKDSANTLTCEATPKQQYGINTNPPAGTINLYVPCEDTRCKTCATNYKECTKCTDNTDLRFNQGVNNIKCFATATAVPAGIGKDLLLSTATDLYYWKCADSNCATCPDNRQVCTACTGGTFALKQLYRDVATPDVICVLKTSYNLVPGFGWKTVNARIEPCADIKCIQCFDDVSICKECASPKLLKKTLGTPDTYTCEDINADTGKYGLVVPDVGGFIRLYEPCATGCDKCFANSQVCNKCTDPAWARIYYSPISIICKNQNAAGFVEKVGRNEYMVPGTSDLFFTKCEQANCDKCLGNYESCEECTVTTNILYRPSHEDIFLCVDPNSIPPEVTPIGLVLPLTDPAQYLPCAIVGCRNCAADYTKCKECNYDYYLQRAAVGQEPTCKKPLDPQYGLLLPADPNYVFLYVPCDDTGCKACVKNYKLCSKCTADTDIRFDKRDATVEITCDAGTAASIVTDGYGRNEDDDLANDLYYSKCFYDDCGKCLDNYKVCTECKTTANSLFKISRELTMPDVKCVADTTVTRGYGFVTVNERIEPCFDPNCVQCDPQDYKVCKECARPFFLKKTGTDYSCETSIVDGFGRDKTDATTTAQFIELYVACPEGCAKCKDDIAICTQCTDSTLFYRVAYKVDDIQCKAIIGFTGAYGRNKYLAPDITNDNLLTKCEQGTCEICLSNYEDCEKCASGNVLVKQTTQQDIYTCTPTANIPAAGAIGIGLVVPNNADGEIRYEPCVTVGCENCLADNKKCMECDEDYFMKKDDTVTVCISALSPSTLDGYGLVKPDALGYIRAYEPCASRCKACFDDIRVCTACTDTSDYRVKYPNVVDIRCLENIPATDIDGFGANAAGNIVVGDNFYESCKWEHCEECKDNYAVCTACTSPYFPINLAADNKPCKKEDEVPVGFGFSAASIWDVCTISGGCQNCLADNLVCKECPPGKYLKRVRSRTAPDAYSCVATTSDLAGYGLNAADTDFVNVYDACANTNCDSCLSSINKCQHCKFDELLHLIDQDTITCEGDVLPGYGLVKTAIYENDYYEKCTDILCKTCDADNNVCEACKATDGTNALYLANTSPLILECKTEASLTGFGLDATLGYYVKCDDRCASCFSSTDVCELCNEKEGDLTLYLFTKTVLGTTTAKCVVFTEIEAGYGIDKAAAISSVRECNPACTKCQADYTKCPECLNPNQVTVLSDNGQKDCADTSFVDAGGFRYVAASTAWVACRRNCKSCDATDSCTSCYLGTAQDNRKVQLKGTSIYCVPFAEIPPGYIPNAEGIFVLCNPECGTCEDNRPTVCKTCTEGKALWHQSANVVTCELPEFISDGFGLRSSDGHYVACEISGCTECHGNYQKCDECGSGLKLWIDGSTGNKCTAIQNIFVNYGPDADGHYVACLDTNCNNCKADLNVCINCIGDYKRMELTTDPENVVCRLIDNIPESHGLIDNMYRKCATGCSKCKANWYQCTECNSGLKLWQKDASETVCETEPLIPDSFGPNSANPVVYVPCSPHCQDCKSNLLKCEYCEDSYSLWEKTAQSTLCEAPNLITGAYGPNTIGTYIPCSSNCLSCGSNSNLCTQCSGTNIIWKKSDDEHVCSLPAAVTGKYGKENPDSASSAFVPCADERCQDCRANYQKCVSCDSGLSLWKQSGSSTVCETPALIPETFGFNSISTIYESCTDPHCNSCQADRTKCIRCESSWSLWIKKDGVTQCAKPQDIVGAYGLNGAGNYVSCGANCNACLADIDVCTECASTYFRWQKTDSTVVCSREAEVTNGFGLATDIYIKCEPECAECKQDQTQCTKCNDPWVMWMKPGTNGICVSKCDVPNGYGLNSDRYVECKDNKCDQCIDNFQVCTLCKTNYVTNKVSATETGCKLNNKDPIIIPTDCPVGCQTCNSQDFCTACVTGDSPKYYMWEKSTTNHICITKGQITDGFGINLGVSDTVIACEAHCLKCKESRYICTECDKANGYAKWFKSEISTICEKPANIPVDNGLNITPDQYEACFDGCLNCANNKAVCMKCDSNRGLRRLLTSATDVTCVTFANIPIGYGIRELEDSEVILCPSEICSGKICPSNGICNPDDNPGNKRIKGTSYDFRTATATITFFNDTDRSIFVPESVMFIGYINDAVVPELADIKYTYRLGDNSGISYILDTDGKDYELTKLMVKSRAKQAHAAASSAMHSQTTQMSDAERQELLIIFDDIEFSFGQVYLIPNLETTGGKRSFTSTFANVLQYILKLIGFAFKVLLIPLDFFLAFTVDMVVATFSYLRLLSAPHVIRPSNIIHYMSSRTLFGFRISNPYKSWADAPECQVPMTIALHSLQCSLFYNYGHNLNILLAALVLAIVVYVLTSLTLWLINDPNDEVNKWTRVVRYFFGFRYFLLFMHGVFLDLFGLVLLNMTADNYSDSAVGAGLGLSIGILVFYVVFYALVTLSIHVKIDLLKAGQPLGLRPAWTYFSFLSDPFRFNGRYPWLLYMALFWPVKSAIVIIIAIAARNSGLGQTVPIFAVEVLGLLILLATRAKKRLIDNAFDVLFQFLLCIYIGTEMVLSGKDDDPDLQDSAVSVFMAVILYAMAILAIVYVIIRAIWAFARLNTPEPISNVLLPPVFDNQEASLLLDRSAAWTVEWD